MANQMYVIKDQDTGRFLSGWSMPVNEKGQQMFISHTGKLGADFFSIRQDAQNVLDALQSINRLGKKLYIGMVDPDSLGLGDKVIEYQKIECFA